MAEHVTGFTGFATARSADNHREGVIGVAGGGRHGQADDPQSALGPVSVCTRFKHALREGRGTDVPSGANLARPAQIPWVAVHGKRDYSEIASGPVSRTTQRDAQTPHRA